MNRRELFAVAVGAVAAPSIKPAAEIGGPFSVLTDKGLYVSDGKGPHPPEIEALLAAGAVHTGGVSLREVGPGIVEMDQGGKRSLALNPMGISRHWTNGVSFVGPDRLKFS